MLSKEDKTLEADYLTREEMQEKWGLSDYQQIYDSYSQAVEETDNIVLWYGDGYPWVPFHQSSNGMTRSAEEVTGSPDYPYIAARECPLDKEAEDEIQVFSFDYSEIQKNAGIFLSQRRGKQRRSRDTPLETSKFSPGIQPGMYRNSESEKLCAQGISSGMHCLFRPVIFPSARMEKK